MQTFLGMISPPTWKVPPSKEMQFTQGSMWYRRAMMDRAAAFSLPVCVHQYWIDQESARRTCSRVRICTSVYVYSYRSVRAILTCYILSTWSSSSSSEACGVAFPPASSAVMTCLSTLSPWLHLCQYAETTPFTEQQQTIRDERLFLCSRSWKHELRLKATVRFPWQMLQYNKLLHIMLHSYCTSEPQCIISCVIFVWIQPPLTYEDLWCLVMG